MESHGIPQQIDGMSGVFPHKTHGAVLQVVKFVH